MRQLVLLDKISPKEPEIIVANSRRVAFLTDTCGVYTRINLPSGDTMGWYYASYELQKLLRRV